MSWLAALKGGAEVAKVVDKFVTTKGERLEMDSKDADTLRTMFDKRIHGTWFDAFVDGVSRLIRPGVTLYLLLGFDGRLIHLPSPNTVDPFWQTALYLVLTFWFGGRALLKDLPKAIMFMNKIRGKL